MSSKRNRRCAAVAATAALVLAGCGGVGGGDEQTPEGGAVLTTMGFGLGDEVAEVRANLANEAIAPATVQVGGSAFDAQQFLSAVASGTAPDMVFMDRQLIGTYAGRGTLMPLTECIESQDVDLSQYREAALGEVTLNGEVYGLPEFFNNRVVLMNDAALESAGLEPAALSTANWDALAQATGQLTRIDANGDLARIGFDPKIPEFLPLWAKANGVDMISADGRTANLDDPRLVEVLEYTVGLIEQQGGWGKFKAFRESFDFFGEQNPVAADQMAAFPMEDWYLNQVASNSPDVPLVVSPFQDRQGGPVDFVTGSAWAIPTDSAHPELACTWIKTMSDAPSWVAAARARVEQRKADGEAFTGLYTANHVADEQIFSELVQLDDLPVYDAAVSAVLEAQEHAFSMPASPAGAEFRTAWQGAVNRVLEGGQQPAEALAQAQQEAQQALDAAPQG
ncbi:extracellular solute-binding protein [Pseudonocardia nigra]|uniref:extracellular solute-binding protein n=1 Tax=Pseudonocardia nigra TaxID=1921578 RepID=UPI001C5D9692|nr:extracellular solute-binding protein [Pseudonocardia nigra]